MAVRVDGWKMHIGVKHKASWFDEKAYPSVAYIVNLLMDPMEKTSDRRKLLQHTSQVEESNAG